jgi:hypothetical protein
MKNGNASSLSSSAPNILLTVCCVFLYISVGVCAAARGQKGFMIDIFSVGAQSSSSIARASTLFFVGFVLVGLLLSSCCCLSDDSDTNMTGPFVWDSSGSQAVIV